MKILYANTINYDHPLQQRPHHIMNKLAKRGHIVYWVNNIHVEGKAKDIINPNLEVYHSWNLFLKRVPEVDVYYSSWSYRHADLPYVKHKLVVYDSLDNFKENSGQESNMIKKAHILLTTSKPLYDLRVKEHNNVIMCRNACFSELGKKTYEIPKDLLPIKNLGKPIILFSGALASDWCDIELIEKVAKIYNLVVVGMPWGVKTMPKNIIYLGKKGYKELQAYYSHCDLSILPFKRCQTADFSNPIKCYEAASHGKITIATDIPEATIYPDVVIPSCNHKQFINNIKKALNMIQRSREKVETKCRQMASENNWFDRVETIENAIGEYCYINKIDI